MGILEQSQSSYYNDPTDYGNYQFTSLDDIINQFIVVYVGENKLISKINRTDVQFHAMRSLAELSFDTFKSIKSQEIVLPPSLTMVLPHDYVNYTKVSFSDNSGIKHPLYPTLSQTSNPLKIRQEDDGGYDFLIPTDGIFLNGDFSVGIQTSGSEEQTAWKRSSAEGQAYSPSGNSHVVLVNNNRLEFYHPVQNISGGFTGRLKACWQEIDVTDVEVIHLSAKALSSAAVTGKTAGIVRIGFSTQVDTTAQSSQNQGGYNPNAGGGNDLLTNFKRNRNMDPTIFDVPNVNGTSFIEFNNGSGTMSAATSLEEVDVSHLDTVYVLIVSSGGTFNSSATFSPTSDPDQNVNTEGINAVDDVTINFEATGNKLLYHPNSTTWDNYKSNKPSENTQHDYDYDDHIFEANVGRRYGIEPSHAQDNGSFYIDNLRGMIHFSSNVSGKTVILDYISDSLGTDGEMQVHKFAEEAMYKSIIYAILSTRANVPEYVVRRYKKERFAAIRAAKLRLSNIKLEEITQIFRGKSKQIKH
jgi:hypothetical protein